MISIHFHDSSVWCRHSSWIQLCLPPQVWVPSTPSTLLSIYWIVLCGKDENKQKEAGIKKLRISPSFCRILGCRLVVSRVVGRWFGPYPQNTLRQIQICFHFSRTPSIKYFRRITHSPVTYDHRPLLPTTFEWTVIMTLVKQKKSSVSTSSSLLGLVVDLSKLSFRCIHRNDKIFDFHTKAAAWDRIAKFEKWIIILMLIWILQSYLDDFVRKIWFICT